MPPTKKGETLLTNSINKVRAVNSILNAICKELKDDAPIFREHFDGYNNPVAVVMSEFESKLTYREKSILGMRLGFNFENNYGECKKESYDECAISFEMSCAQSASRIYHKSLCKLATYIIGATE